MEKIMDKLDLLFQMQRELNIKIAKKNGIQDLWDLMEFDHGETSTRRKWLENFSDAMQSELVELTDSTKKFEVIKWEKNQKCLQKLQAEFNQIPTKPEKIRDLKVDLNALQPKIKNNFSIYLI